MLSNHDVDAHSFWVVFLGLFSLWHGHGQAAGRAHGLQLVVVIIVVDQMRRDYVEDYGSHWTKGLRRSSTRARGSPKPRIRT